MDSRRFSVDCCKSANRLVQRAVRWNDQNVRQFSDFLVGGRWGCWASLRTGSQGNELIVLIFAFVHLAGPIFRIKIRRCLSGRMPVMLGRDMARDTNGGEGGAGSES
jgi:hypothetical protein